MQRISAATMSSAAYNQEVVWKRLPYGNIVKITSSKVFAKTLLSTCFFMKNL